MISFFSGACNDCDCVFTLCFKTELHQLPIGLQPEMWGQIFLRLESRLMLKVLYGLKLGLLTMNSGHLDFTDERILCGCVLNSVYLVWVLGKSDRTGWNRSFWCASISWHRPASMAWMIGYPDMSCAQPLLQFLYFPFFWQLQKNILIPAVTSRDLVKLVWYRYISVLEANLSLPLWVWGSNIEDVGSA